MQIPFFKSLSRPRWIVLILVLASYAFGGFDPSFRAFSSMNSDFQFTSDERIAGTAQREDISCFVFDPAAYGINRPLTRVVLTGQFRNWSQDMDDGLWQLQRDSKTNLWVLEINNPNYSVIPPSVPFKFRIDDGQWMQPPSKATNVESGNLIFAPGIEPIRLKAEIRTTNTIWIRLTGNNAVRSLNPADYRMTSDSGKLIPIAEVLPNTATESLLCLAEEIDRRHVYHLEMPGQDLKTLCRRDGWFRTLYSDKPLGAEIAPDGKSTTFRLFAPRAERVGLYLYHKSDDSPRDAFKTIDMERDHACVWEATVPGDLHGTYYDFTVHGVVERGNHFYESHPVHISDPYARVSLDSFGKSRVWRATKPAAPLQHGRPRMEDVIAYEVHVQDFTSELPVDPSLKGTLPAMTMRGLKNSRGESVGFDHLTKLGINVVHLMPVQEFLHYPDDEWQAAFKNDPFMKEHGVNLENYDWGYRTTHAFAIESRFRKRGTENGAERDQFRDLVQAFHDVGIAVIIDIVPNHTGENMDGRNYLFNFGAIDTDYYYRTNNDLVHIGPYGNEVKFEDRPMTQRWLVDQCKNLINEFGIDGFRIDLAGQIDKQTLMKLRQAVGDDAIIYGEPWIPPSDPEVARNPSWGWYKKDSPITYFQDASRNAFKGPTSNPTDKATSRGFAGGDGAQREAVMMGLTNNFEDELHPNLGINYLDIHDNWALADQFAKRDWDGRFGVDEGPFRIAAGLLFTSLGPIVLHGGTEFMRSKGSAGLAETTKVSASGPLAYHGKSDTYNMRIPNLFLWENVGRPADASNGNCDYKKMLNYWRGLAAFRNSEFGTIFRVGLRPSDGYYRWILPADSRLLGYVVADRVLVLANASDKPGKFGPITLPTGNWQLISDGESIDVERGVSGTDAKLSGNVELSLSVPATTMKIWVKR